MDEDDRLRLEKTIDDGERLLSLSIFGNVLDSIVEDISRSDARDDLGHLSELIKYQRMVYDKAVSLYEKMQSEGVDVDEVKICLEDFDESLRNYHEFSNKTEAPSAPDVEVGSDEV